MKIVIPGIPVPQARMKHSNRRGFVTTYDPKAKEKSHIRQLLENSRVVNPIDYPRISFLFQMAIPNSIPKRDKQLYESGRLKHDKKPDVDNLVKLYLDCLDGIVLHGDQKVSLGPCIKVYHREPKTIVYIQETTNIMQPWEQDVELQYVLKPGKQCFCAPDYPSGYDNLSHPELSLFDHKNGLLDTILPLERLALPPSLQELVDKASQRNGSPAYDSVI